MDFGVMIPDPKTKQLCYYIRIRKADAKGDLSDTVELTVSGGLYAVFDTPVSSQHDFVTEIRATWKWIYETWLPQSGYQRGDGFELECYTESDRSFTERIYIPLKSRKKEI